MLNETLPSGLHVTEDDNGIGWITFDRPQVSNAISPQLATDLGEYIPLLGAQPKVRVVILQGRGKNFCAGYDLGHLADITANAHATTSVQGLMSNIVVQLRRMPQPVIALVQGAAAGAGFAIALAADIRYATPDARMNVAMARIGLTGCDMGISYHLPRLVGSSLAAELMMTGRFIDAARAERTGLVSEIVPQEELRARGAALAGEMLALSPSGLRLTKQGLIAAIDAGSLDQVIPLEDRGQIITIGQHMKEGVAAFREKRRAIYSNE